MIGSAIRTIDHQGISQGGHRNRAVIGLSGFSYAHLHLPEKLPRKFTRSGSTFGLVHASFTGVDVTLRLRSLRARIDFGRISFHEVR
jgi:hypothetical protein